MQFLRKLIKAKPHILTNMKSSSSVDEPYLLGANHGEHSYVSRADWWRRWLYSTNAKDIGTLYLYFAIFSGIIMPLKNLAIFWKNFYFYVNDKFKWKSVDNWDSYCILKYLRDSMQELLQLFIIYIFSLLFSYLFIFNNNSLFYYNNSFNIRETTCSAPLKINKDNGELGYYLAGLIEADDSIIVPNRRSKNTPTISISFNIIDKPLVICIKNRLGFGSIENIEKNNAVRLIIRGKYNILTLVALINGKFRTPKIEKLHELINYINNIWLEPKNYLVCLNIDNSSFTANSQLAGFSDGDANLNINLIWPCKSKNGYSYIRLTFELVQNRLNEEHLNKYKYFMESLSIFFKSKLEVHNISKYDRLGKQKAWRVRITNKIGASVIVNYFDKYPMFSSKYMNYQNWRNVYEILIIRKEHIGINKLNTYKKVEKIKNQMNNKRCVFNWDHLNDFYKYK